MRPVPPAMNRLSSEDSSDPSSDSDNSLAKSSLLTRSYTSTTRIGRTIWGWVEGPNPPQVLRIKPLFPEVQTWPMRMRDRLLPKKWHKIAALATLYVVWMTLFVLITDLSRFETWTEEEYGQTMTLTCSNAVWYKNNGCGLDGLECTPFTDQYIPFRCPSECIHSGRVMNPRAVGTQEKYLEPFVVGGPPTNASEIGLPHGGKYNATYRADSFICDAALHAGVISNRFGGCGLLKMTGTKNLFPGSNRNGISSAGFDASFPSSFSFLPIDSKHCTDLRWHLLPVTIFFTTLTILTIQNPYVVFFTVFPAIFFHVSFASDPPYLRNPYEMLSTTMSRFLPAAFIAYVLGTHIVNKTINTSARIEVAILWLGGLWVGALNNLTFDVIIPLARLTPRDLNAQPGAKAALAIIIIVLAVICISQVFFIRLTGKLPKYLALYIAFGVSLGLLTAIPGVNLRIHHYILALLFLPGTAFQTRPSLLYQGLLIGLHINGVARWGFAGILETPASLRGDGALFSSLPRIQPPPLVGSSNVTIFWNATDYRTGDSFPYPWDGISVLVNDVERARFREPIGNFTWDRLLRDQLVKSEEELLEEEDDTVETLSGEAVNRGEEFEGVVQQAIERRAMQAQKIVVAGENAGSLKRRNEDRLMKRSGGYEMLKVVRKRKDDPEEGRKGKRQQKVLAGEYEPLYVRIAYTKGQGGSLVTADYTKAGVVLADGSWKAPEIGRS
ncbi:hypothetical protein BJ508DRAFT_309858 [Ascobolus immersus RN42]|uniref:LCCL domain-containing protein n=1 Tax=Ascobolus immersus RN42 TaxID=1160509 RepID=A0A3N4HV53_ASCIM|nr:hypothetical protein BJ508DRAFT_309858 [Ascobolus immersus RN42]